MSSHNQLEADLAARLCARIPSFDLVRFTNSGTEANLMAINAARAFTAREKIIVFAGGFHGGVLNFSGLDRRMNAPFDFLILPYNDELALRDVVRQQPSEIAAILVEPMQGAGGCRVAADQFLQETRNLADEIGAVLIFDEVQTSRLHIGGRQAALGIVPDMTTVGKFFGGGLAFGCFGGRSDIMLQFDPRRADALGHPGTFNNNTLTMAAGIAAIDRYLSAGQLHDLNERGERMRTGLTKLFQEANAPFSVSGIGSLMNTHPSLGEAETGMLRQLLYLDLLERGFFTAARGLISLSLAITDSDVDAFLDATSAVVIERATIWSKPASTLHTQ